MNPIPSIDTADKYVSYLSRMTQGDPGRRSALRRGLGRPVEDVAVKGGERHSDRAQAVLELPGQRVVDRLMIEPGRGQDPVCDGSLLGGDRQQEMLCLNRRRPVPVGFVSSLHDDHVEVCVERGHRQRLLSVTPAAMSRLACFL